MQMLLLQAGSANDIQTCVNVIRPRLTLMTLINNGYGEASCLFSPTFPFICEQVSKQVKSYRKLRENLDGRRAYRHI